MSSISSHTTRGTLRKPNLPSVLDVASRQSAAEGANQISRSFSGPSNGPFAAGSKSVSADIMVGQQVVYNTLSGAVVSGEGVGDLWTHERDGLGGGTESGGSKRLAPKIRKVSDR